MDDDTKNLIFVFGLLGAVGVIGGIILELTL